MQVTVKKVNLGKLALMRNAPSDPGQFTDSRKEQTRGVQRWMKRMTQDLKKSIPAYIGRAAWIKAHVRCRKNQVAYAIAEKDRQEFRDLLAVDAKGRDLNHAPPPGLRLVNWLYKAIEFAQAACEKLIEPVKNVAGFAPTAALLANFISCQGPPPGEPVTFTAPGRTNHAFPERSSTEVKVAVHPRPAVPALADLNAPKMPAKEGRALAKEARRLERHDWKRVFEAKLASHPRPYQQCWHRCAKHPTLHARTLRPDRLSNNARTNAHRLSEILKGGALPQWQLNQAIKYAEQRFDRIGDAPAYILATVLRWYDNPETTFSPRNSDISAAVRDHSNRKALTTKTGTPYVERIPPKKARYAVVHPDQKQPAAPYAPRRPQGTGISPLKKASQPMLSPKQEQSAAPVASSAQAPCITAPLVKRPACAVAAEAPENVAAMAVSRSKWEWFAATEAGKSAKAKQMFPQAFAGWIEDGSPGYCQD